MVPVSTGPGAAADAVEEWAGPGFFHMIGMHVLAGREFTWRDDEHAPRVAVVSENLARALFPNQNPIGRSINVGVEPEDQGLKIIGVVNNANLWKFDGHQPLAVYHSAIQEKQGGKILIRTRGNPSSVAHAAEHVIESLNYQYSLRTETLEQRTDETLVLQRMIAMLASGFSLLALLLAAIGLYGVMSYAVTRRTAEIGVRMALGALRPDVLRMILGEVLLLIAIGIGIALPVAFACGKFISGMLFGISVTDPTTVLISSAILIAVAALAGFLPALRASRVDPMVALRYE
jgi:predicted permease